MQSTLGFLLYENVQPMDVIGPWEVFATWKNVLHAPLDMFLVSEHGNTVNCDNGIMLNSHLDFAGSPPFDYLVIPGGRGRTTQVHNQHLLSFIRKQAEHAKCILSVCTGAFLLYESGILKEECITTYWRALPELLALNHVNVKEQRIVKSGKIWASGGVSSGIDLALEVIADMAGKEIAGQVQLLFEYFPEGKLYTSLDTAHTLPAYYNNQAAPHLADYIVNLIKSKS